MLRHVYLSLQPHAHGPRILMLLDPGFTHRLGCSHTDLGCSLTNPRVHSDCSIPTSCCCAALLQLAVTPAKCASVSNLTKPRNIWHVLSPPFPIWRVLSPGRVQPSPCTTHDGSRRARAPWGCAQMCYLHF